MGCLIILQPYQQNLLSQGLYTARVYPVRRRLPGYPAEG